MNFAKSPQKSWAQRFVNWTFGATEVPQRSEYQALAGDIDIDRKEQAFGFDTSERPSDTVPVWVEQKARSALEAFKDAITDGTRLFCEQNVYPLYVLDERTKYRVTGIQVFVPRDKSSFLQPLEILPIEVRNRMARILVMAAPGASEQLVVDDGFFGISLDVEPTVIEGQAVRLIASWSIDSVEIKLLFSGQYISVEPKPSVTSVKAERPLEDKGAKVVQNPTPQLAGASEDLSKKTDSPHQPGPKLSPVEPTPATTQKNKAVETPLGIPVIKVTTGSVTPFMTPSARQIAFVRIQYAGQDQETTVAVTQDMLPFTIGREHTSTGRFKNGISLADPKDPNLGMLVSREHLEISRYEPDSGTFFLINHGHPRNGSYHLGSALSERFMFKAQSPNNVIQLGGNGGVGTVRVTIEAA